MFPDATPWCKLVIMPLHDFWCEGLQICLKNANLFWTMYCSWSFWCVLRNTCLMQEVVEMPLHVDHFLGRGQTGSCQDAVHAFLLNKFTVSWRWQLVSISVRSIAFASVHATVWLSIVAPCWNEAVLVTGAAFLGPVVKFDFARTPSVKSRFWQGQIWPPTDTSAGLPGHQIWWCSKLS